MTSAVDRFRRTGLFQRIQRSESLIGRMVLLRLAGASHYFRHGHLARRRQVSKYLSRSDEPRLQIGSGPMSLEGWLDSDLLAGDIHLDLERRLPLPDSSFQYVFGEHVIEHLTQSAGSALLAEIHRILRPGGVVRMTTPDLMKIIALYEDRNPVIGLADYSRFLDGETGGKPHELRCQVLNDLMRQWGHRYIYDEEDLAAKLTETGFQQIERVEPGQSQHPQLKGAEQRPEWQNQAEAMTLEATKPALSATP
jgi:predicted SAM-dependent methyltransferase